MDTYPLVPNRIASGGIEFKTTVVEYETGDEQRSADRSSPIRIFRLFHQILDNTNQKILEDFFVAKRGRAIKFYFVNHIDKVTYECRFHEDKLQFEYINALFANIILELRTC